MKLLLQSGSTVCLEAASKRSEKFTQSWGVKGLAEEWVLPLNTLLEEDRRSE